MATQATTTNPRPIARPCESCDGMGTIVHQVEFHGFAGEEACADCDGAGARVARRPAIVIPFRPAAERYAALFAIRARMLASQGRCAHDVWNDHGDWSACVDCGVTTVTGKAVA